MGLPAASYSVPDVVFYPLEEEYCNCDVHVCGERESHDLPITQWLLLCDKENIDCVIDKEDQDSKGNTELHIGRLFHTKATQKASLNSSWSLKAKEVTPSSDRTKIPMRGKKYFLQLM